MTYYSAQSIRTDEGTTIPNCDVESFLINNTTGQRNGRNNLTSIFLLSLQANIQGLFSISPLPDAAGTLGSSSAHVQHTYTNWVVVASQADYHSYSSRPESLIRGHRDTEPGESFSESGS